jgi:hypothetical protein
VADPSPPGKELSSRDDLLLEQQLADLHQATLTLAISLKSCRRSTDNIVLRMSAEQQFESAMGHVGPLLGLSPVMHDVDAARRVTEALAPFFDLVAQLHWTPAGSRIVAAFQEAANMAFADPKVKVEGRPCQAYEALLATRATIPVAAPPPPQDAAPSATPVAAPDPPVVLYEATFTQGDGQPSHHALVGGMFLAFLVHVRGLSEEEARQKVSPAALIGFAQSIDKALADYEGVVAFRIVRKDGKGDAQLLRLAAR